MQIEVSHLRKFNGRTHTTARFLCARFNIRPDLFGQALDTIEIETGQGALLDGTERWIDSSLFYDLSISPELTEIFTEERQQTILHLLGHFNERPATGAGTSVTRRRSCA